MTSPRMFSMQDLRRAQDLPALLDYVSEQRAALEYDRRVDLGLKMPTGLSGREKERHLARHPEYPFEAKIYDLSEIGDDELVAYLLSATPPSPLSWLDRVTGPRPLERRNKPYEPKRLIVQVQSEPIPVALWAHDHPDNPYRRDRSHVVRIGPPGSRPDDDTDQDDEQEQT